MGGLDHTEWRSFKNERRTSQGKFSQNYMQMLITRIARSFIDGDLIESFLDLQKEDMKRVVDYYNEKVWT